MAFFRKRGSSGSIELALWIVKQENRLKQFKGGFHTNPEAKLAANKAKLDLLFIFLKQA
jgi:hypothetical protein